MPSHRLIAYAAAHQILPENCSVPISIFSDFQILSTPQPADKTLSSFQLHLHFEVLGDIARVLSLEEHQVTPVQSLALRRNELWKQTCFECFWGIKNSASYFEANLSPQGFWNLYAFNSYRENLNECPLASGLSLITKFHGSTEFHLDAVIPLPETFMKETGSSFASLEYNNTAVIQLPAPWHQQYFAIQHCPEKPDFHFRKAFTSYMQK